MMVMPRSTKFFVFILALLVILFGYNYYAQPFIKRFNEQIISVPDQPVLTEVEFNQEEQPVWQQITLRGKIAHLIAMPITLDPFASATSLEDQDWLEWLKINQPGFVTIFGSQISTTSAQLYNRAIKDVENDAGVPVWIAVDHEGGVVQRLSGDGFLKLPSWKEMCNLDLAERENLLQQSASELSESGVNLVLAPVVDIARNNLVLTSRICSDEVEVVEAVAANYIDSFTKKGVFPVLKHFPGIGSTNRDLHFGFDRVTVTLEEVLVYRQLLDRFPRLGVMVSHVGVNNQFPDIPCSLSVDCVFELRNNYPDTLVFSDALEMKSAFYIPPSSGETRTIAQVSLAALIAGNDVLVYGPSLNFNQLDEVIEFIEKSANEDPATLERIDQSFEKIVYFKLQSKEVSE